MRFQQQLTQITGTVNVQSQQRLVGTFTLAGASGTFTVTGLLPSDQFLWFVFDPAQAGADPVRLIIAGVANTNQTYGTIVVTTQTPDFTSCLPLVENQVTATYKTLISGTNPIGIKVYASPVQPSTIKKLTGAVQFQGAMTAGQIVTLANASQVWRLWNVSMSITQTASGPVQVHFDLRDTNNVINSWYLDCGISPAGSSSTAEISIPLNGILVSGITGGNAASFTADNVITLATCTLIADNLRGA